MMGEYIVHEALNEQSIIRMNLPQSVATQPEAEDVIVNLSAQRHLVHPRWQVPFSLTMAAHWPAAQCTSNRSWRDRWKEAYQVTDETTR